MGQGGGQGGVSAGAQRGVGQGGSLLVRKGMLLQYGDLKQCLGKPQVVFSLFFWFINVFF